MGDFPKMFNLNLYSDRSKSKVHSEQNVICDSERTDMPDKIKKICRLCMKKEENYQNS